MTSISMVLNMENMLQPWNEKIECEGKVTYHEAIGAWNTIRIKRIFLDQFPLLRDKQANIKFKLEYYGTPEKLAEAVAKITEQKKGMPMFLYLYRE
ncbi:hypothetical protein KY346_00100 [Candidatus Woesearchaeota archaeon]|nr:hypothetical protein [Candidatus Woesearchaeota archaeon]